MPFPDSDLARPSELTCEIYPKHTGVSFFTNDVFEEGIGLGLSDEWNWSFELLHAWSGVSFPVVHQKQSPNFFVLPSQSLQGTTLVSDRFKN